MGQQSAVSGVHQAAAAGGGFEFFSVNLYRPPRPACSTWSTLVLFMALFAIRRSALGIKGLVLHVLPISYRHGSESHG